MSIKDDWPTGPDGKPYNGLDLLDLVRAGQSPFKKHWDVNLLIQEIETQIHTKITNIPIVTKGSNNYGFHITTKNTPDIIVRLARGDVNMPDFDGFPIVKQISEVHFEAAVYRLLESAPGVRASKLLYYRAPEEKPELEDGRPVDLAGRRLMIFERAEGLSDVWKVLGEEHKRKLLTQLARIRAALFQFTVPLEFAERWFHERTFDFKPPSLSMPVSPTRDFFIHVLESKIHATIGDPGDMIGWEDDEETVGPIALAARESLLRVIPYITPLESVGDGANLYRFVLEHGDFGIHNTFIKQERDGKPVVTSLYDWETGCFVPAILSDALVAVDPVDLITDEFSEPSITRIPESVTATDLITYGGWARDYIEDLFCEAPDYKVAIVAGKDVRRLWFALRDWRGGNAEEFFGGLGAWAEERMKELGVS